MRESPGGHKYSKVGGNSRTLPARTWWAEVPEGGFQDQERGPLLRAPRKGRWPGRQRACWPSRQRFSTVPRFPAVPRFPGVRPNPLGLCLNPLGRRLNPLRLRLNPRGFAFPG